MIVVAGILAGLGAPPSAWAATSAELVDGSVLQVTGDAGVNDITVADGTVHDAAALVTVGEGCVLEDEHTAVCSGFFELNEVDAGDGADTVRSSALDHDSWLDGGPGDDHLEAVHVESPDDVPGGRSRRGHAGRLLGSQRGRPLRRASRRGRRFA